MNSPGNKTTMKLAAWLLVFNGVSTPITQADLDLRTMHLVADGVDRGRVAYVEFRGGTVTAKSDLLFANGMEK